MADNADHGGVITTIVTPPKPRKQPSTVINDDDWLQVPPSLRYKMFLVYAMAQKT